MRTTLNLDERLVQELMKATQAKTKTEAISQAISDLIRRRKLDKLKSLSGKIHLVLDRQKHEKVEMRRQDKVLRRWHGHR
ncbi:MAG: type II toxin-antitoxin system VapB family antitoxin [Nitrospirae bacterium]|nr:type II toxin-antitoxin system VapB family antitoxin [Nitrospirota bacterium]